MDMILFRTPAGEELAISHDDIVQIWAGQKANEVVIVPVDGETVTVAGDFITIMRAVFNTLDARPSAVPTPSPKPRVVK